MPGMVGKTIMAINSGDKDCVCYKDVALLFILSCYSYYKIIE